MYCFLHSGVMFEFSSFENLTISESDVNSHFLRTNVSLFVSLFAVYNWHASLNQNVMPVKNYSYLTFSRNPDEEIFDLDIVQADDILMVRDRLNEEQGFRREM